MSYKRTHEKLKKKTIISIEEKKNNTLPTFFVSPMTTVGVMFVVQKPGLLAAASWGAYKCGFHHLRRLLEKKI
jgi:hypothetical protein